MYVRCPECGNSQAVEVDSANDFYFACAECAFTAGPVPLREERLSLFADLLLSPIPSSEISRLMDAVAGAGQLAEQGLVARGFDRLQGARDRVEKRSGEQSWGPELVARYRLETDRYCLTRGVRIGVPAVV
jgi:hypothetical protein